MRYQVIEQRAPGEKWNFVAHGARMSKAEATESIARGKANGIRRKAISCGKESGK
jgi:hypothetical protein